MSERVSYVRLREMFEAVREAENYVGIPEGAVRLVPRGWAADILTTVGDCIEYGGESDSVTAREIGWALKRVFGYIDVEQLPELIKGYQEATEWYSTGEIPSDLK